MHCTYFGVPKGTSRDEATLNSKKIKPIALAVIELRLSEDIRQLVITIKFRKKYFLKFHKDLQKKFLVDLKACSGLVLTNQYCLFVIWKN